MSEECPFYLKTVSKMEPLEYRSVIKFLNMQGKSPSVIFEEMFGVYEEECPSYETVKYWVRKFKSGFLSIHDSPREGRTFLWKGYAVLLLGQRWHYHERLFRTGPYNNWKLLFSFVGKLAIYFGQEKAWEAAKRNSFAS